mmetsp:Transcript_45769/g.98119  ORF Transcript_45769/g.98119 Transcript_45769/m.98119 type:complete len:377 (-) Transcript_45769:320-1450(-)
MLWSDELELHLGNVVLLGLRVGKHHSGFAPAFSVGEDVELVLLALTRRQVEGVDAVEADLVPGILRFDERQLHREALRLAEPIRDLDSLHVRGLALHGRLELFDEGWGRGSAGEGPGMEVPIGRRQENGSLVLFRTEFAWALLLSPRGSGREVRALFAAAVVRLLGAILVLQRHRQWSIGDVKLGLATRRDHDLGRAEPIVHAIWHLRLQDRIQLPGLVGGILAIWGECDFLGHLLSDCTSEVQSLHCTLWLLDPSSLDDKFDGVLLVGRLDGAADALRLALLGLSADGGPLGARAAAHGVELNDEADIGVRGCKARGRGHREELTHPRRHLEPELDAQVSKIVKFHMPHACGLENDVAEEQRVLGQFDLGRVAGA